MFQRCHGTVSSNIKLIWQVYSVTVCKGYFKTSTVRPSFKQTCSIEEENNDNGMSGGAGGKRGGPFSVMPVNYIVDIPAKLTRRRSCRMRQAILPRAGMAHLTHCERCSAMRLVTYCKSTLRSISDFNPQNPCAWSLKYETGFLATVAHKISYFGGKHSSPLRIRFQFLPQGEHSKLTLETPVG
jgi:hypothetical protein